jgi:GcrA cell cycle regulator
MGVVAWSEEQSQFLRDLIGNGASFAVAAAEINARFNTNFTRNAAIGRAQRIGLCSVRPRVTAKREKPARRRPLKTAAGPRIVPVRPVRETIEVRCAEVEPLRLSLADLQPHNCRYPYGDRAITFCGHAKSEGSSYCLPHKFLCTQERRPGAGGSTAAQRFSLILKKRNMPQSVALEYGNLEEDAA